MCDSTDFVDYSALIVSELQKRRSIELIYADVETYGIKLQAEFPRLLPKDPVECVHYMNKLATRGLIHIAVSDAGKDGYDQTSRPIFTQVNISVAARPGGIPNRPKNALVRAAG